MQYPLKQEPMRYRGSGFPPYIRRMLKWKQMDLEYTFWQMYLMCVNPKVVYWHPVPQADEEPMGERRPGVRCVPHAMIAITTLYCAFYAHSAAAASSIVFRVVFVDFIGVGASSPRHSAGEQQVPPGRASGPQPRGGAARRVALRLRRPLQRLLPSLRHVVLRLQLVLSPILLSTGFVPRLLSRGPSRVSLSYYHYCAFVGFNALPFLDNTVLFLYPVALIALATPVLLLLGFNPTRFVLSIYFSDILS